MTTIISGHYFCTAAEVPDRNPFDLLTMWLGGPILHVHPLMNVTFCLCCYDDLYGSQVSICRGLSVENVRRGTAAAFLPKTSENTFYKASKRTPSFDVFGQAHLLPVEDSCLASMLSLAQNIDKGKRKPISSQFILCLAGWCCWWPPHAQPDPPAPSARLKLCRRGLAERVE